MTMVSLAPGGRAAVGAVIGLIVFGVSGFTLIGSLCGSLVWSYLTVTWPFTARPSALVPSGLSTLDAALIGAGLGAVGGLLLFAIRALRSREG